MWFSIGHDHFPLKTNELCPCSNWCILRLVVQPWRTSCKWDLAPILSNHSTDFPISLAVAYLPVLSSMIVYKLRKSLLLVLRALCKTKDVNKAISLGWATAAFYTLHTAIIVSMCGNRRWENKKHIKSTTLWEYVRVPIASVIAPESIARVRVNAGVSNYVYLL